MRIRARLPTLILFALLLELLRIPVAFAAPPVTWIPEPFRDPTYQSTNPSSRYFSASYDQARLRFREASATLGREVVGMEVGQLQVPSLQDDDLSIDFTYVPARGAASLVVITSGVHGAEGYAGSALQLRTLETLATTPAATSPAYLFIHGINPYGFKYFRRATEANVDLNRNFLAPDSSYQISNPGAQSLDAFLNPEGEVNPRSVAEKFFGLRLMLAAARHGKSQLAQGIAGGQYQSNRGIMYGGQAPEIQRELLLAYASTAREVLLLDLHTGFGERGKLHKFGSRRAYEAAPREHHAVFGDDLDIPGRAPGFYETQGDFVDYVPQLFAPGKTLGMTFEFGTLNSERLGGAIATVRGLRNENRGYFWGYRNAEAREKVLARFREQFLPSSEEWRARALGTWERAQREVVARFVARSSAAPGAPASAALAAPPAPQILGRCSEAL